MNQHDRITEADLQAYVDGALSGERRHLVEAHLRSDPDAAARVRDFERINAGLHRLYDGTLIEPIPVHLLPSSQGRFRWARSVAAALAVLVFGATLGWVARGPAELGLQQSLQGQLVQPAAFAHVVYASEIRHPVEVAADQEAHLIEWLSKRLKTPLRAPDLSGEGFRLVGGRLLPSTDRMAAQFMYEDLSGNRVTLYVRRGAWRNELTAFRYVRRTSVGVFYWIDGPLGYALSGDLDRAALLRLSETVHRQLTQS